MNINNMKLIAGKEEWRIRLFSMALKAISWTKPSRIRHFWRRFSGSTQETVKYPQGPGDKGMLLIPCTE